MQDHRRAAESAGECECRIATDMTDEMLGTPTSSSANSVEPTRTSAFPAFICFICSDKFLLCVLGVTAVNNPGQERTPIPQSQFSISHFPFPYRFPCRFPFPCRVPATPSFPESVTAVTLPVVPPSDPTAAAPPPNVAPAFTASAVPAATLPCATTPLFF